MRKRICLILVLALLLGLAIPVRAEADFYADLLDQVNAVSELAGEAKRICAGARAELSAYAASYRNALATLGTYDLNGFKVQLAQRGAAMDGVASKLSTLNERLGLIQPGDDRQRAVLEACREYAAEALSAANSFRSANAFHRAQYATSAPLDELSAIPTGTMDDVTFASEWMKAADSVYFAFCEMTPPDYLAQAWEAYLRQVRLFAVMCETKTAALDYDDVMLLYSSSQLLAREYDVMAKYELALYDLHAREYAQVEARLSFMAGHVEPALQNACQNGGEADFSYREQQPELTLDYQLADAVYPNLYHTMDSAVNLIAHTDWGRRDILMTAEIVGFSQEYRQKLTVTSDLTRLTIKPPVLTDVPNLFNTRDTQLIFTVTDAATGELLVQESQPLKLHSLYDYELRDNEFGTVQYYDILSWLTPESEGILKVRREAIRWLEEHTDMTTLAGYQNVLGLENDKRDINTQLQAIGLQGAISDLGVRYNWGAYSLNSFQRVLTPDAVIDSQSGICIETSVLLASALKSTGMHAMILFIPGHAQVALETWKDSHEYFLLETTTLPFSESEDDITAYCTYLTQEQWAAYLKRCAEAGVAYVVDCDLLDHFGYQGLY